MDSAPLRSEHANKYLGGYAAVVPGDPDSSHLLHKVTASAAKERMPPPKTGKQLTAGQVQVLRAWIQQGARWRRHWSLVPPTRPALPAGKPVRAQRWPRNAVDTFVLAQLQERGLDPAPQASRRTLIRRLSFDLTGLPPSPEEVEAFIKDQAPGSYERVVDRLFASPHYGERMAMVWLDAARYSDTDGFQADATRSNWPWRDWVIDAYNRNLPFDQFAIEQFAGDLLPDARPDQILATCFHRNHMTNGEGGRHPEESRVDYVIDRVNTTGTVFLGMTAGCAQCHDHKYDSLSQRDYYRLSAFFNSIDEDGRAGSGAKPFLTYKSPLVRAGTASSQAWSKNRAAALQTVEAQALTRFDSWLREQAEAVAAGGHRSWIPAAAADIRTTHGSRIRQREDLSFEVRGPNPRHDDYILQIRPKLPRVTGLRLRLLPHRLKGKSGWSLAEDGHAILTNLKVSVIKRGQQQVREITVRSAVADYQKRKSGDKSYGAVRDVLDDDPRTGWSTQGSKTDTERIAVFGFAEPVVLAETETISVELRHRSLRGNSNIRNFRLEWTQELGPAVQAVGATPLERLSAARGEIARLDKATNQALRSQFLAGDPQVLAARDDRRLAKQRLNRYRSSEKGVKVMVLKERKKPRSTFVLERGSFEHRGPEVTAGAPEQWGRWPREAPVNRLGLAQWLVDGRHPLTARVAANRYWLMLFGDGLVRTPEDFGVQGSPPTHPKLLDWLATEFVDSGWDVKRLLKLIVMSSTYRQSSDVSKELLERDPENRWLARANRFRLPAWMIRDSALATSGLLNRRLGGPPAYPYQPSGVWASYTMGRFHYQHSVGDDLYRRSVYTFWRRLVAPTAMFDASKRRACQIRVIRTNTPLHALTLLNDTTFVEAARVLAGRVMRSHPREADRISALVEHALGRPPTAEEFGHLVEQVRAIQAHYAADPGAAHRLLGVGETPRATGSEATDHAAFTVLASTLLNLDEAISRG